MLTPLHQLAAGQEGRLASFSGPTGNVQRLEEIGMRPGTWVRVLRRGTPCIISVEGQRLTFRDHNTEVLVEVAPTSGR